MWATIAADRWMEIKSHPERISNLRKFVNNYDWSGLEFPVSLKQIKKFEGNNNISVNILGLEGKDIHILRKGRTHNNNREINLLMISENGVHHYTAIKSLSRLLRSSNTKHHGKQYFCQNCSHPFSLETSRDKHKEYCENNEAVRVEMPKNGTVEFVDGQAQYKVPFVMYYDLESLLPPIPSGSKDPDSTYTNFVSQHIPVVGQLDPVSLTEIYQIQSQAIEDLIVLKIYVNILNPRLFVCIDCIQRNL